MYWRNLSRNVSDQARLMGCSFFFRAGRDLTPQGLFELKILCSEMS